MEKEEKKNEVSESLWWKITLAMILIGLGIFSYCIMLINRT